MKQAEIATFLERYSAGEYAEDDHQRFVEWLKTAPIHEVEQAMDKYSSIQQQLQGGAMMNISCFKLKKPSINTNWVKR
jgi:hypothetical protein